MSVPSAPSPVILDLPAEVPSPVFPGDRVTLPDGSVFEVCRVLWQARGQDGACVEAVPLEPDGSSPTE